MLKEQIKTHYDSLGVGWRRKVWVDDSEFGNEIREFASISSSSKLLDVGIGAGDFSGLFEANTVVGIDISKTHLDECRRLRPQAYLVLGDAEGMPFKKDQFDVVCARNLLQNLVSPL